MDSLGETEERKTAMWRQVSSFLRFLNISNNVLRLDQSRWCFLRFARLLNLSLQTVIDVIKPVAKLVRCVL